MIARARTTSTRAKSSQAFTGCCAMLFHALQCTPLSSHSALGSCRSCSSHLNDPATLLLFFKICDSLPFPLIQAILINTFDRALVSSMSGTWSNMCKFMEYHNMNIQCSWYRLRKGSGKEVPAQATKETTRYLKLVGTWLSLRYLSKGDSPMICINTNV